MPRIEPGPSGKLEKYSPNWTAPFPPLLFIKEISQAAVEGSLFVCTVTGDQFPDDTPQFEDAVLNFPNNCYEFLQNPVKVSTALFLTSPEPDTVLQYNPPQC